MSRRGFGERVGDDGAVTTQTPQRPAATPPPRRNPAGWIIGGVIALIVIIAGVVVLTTGDDDESNDSTPSVETLAPGAAEDPDGETGVSEAPPTTGAGDTAAPGQTTAPAPVELQQTQPVTVTGDPLPQYDKDADVDAGIGLQAPVLSGAGFDGTPVTIAPGKPTLVVFLAHWCPHCQREVPRLVEWAADGDVPAGLDVIGVTTGTEESAPNYPPSEWLAAEEWPFPAMADDADQTAATVMGIPSYPYFVLLDAEGRVAWRVTGEMDTGDLTDEIVSRLGL